MKTKLYIWLFLLAVPIVALAQPQAEWQDAYEHYQNGDFIKAAEIIDEVIQTKKGGSDVRVWHIRGFIYKEIYVNVDDLKRDSDARDRAVESLKKSFEMDQNKTFEVQNRKALRYLGVSYFNDASDIIDERQEFKLDKANDMYLAFKDVILFLNPDTNLVEKDVEFYLAMSTAYRKLYEDDRENRESYWMESNKYLLKVLEIDPANWAAHYSISVSHYNKGAYNLQKLPGVDDIMDLYSIQAESIRSIEMALPYMLKAYEIDPDKIETIRGLKWIYFNLHNEEQSDKFNQKIEQQKDN